MGADNYGLIGLQLVNRVDYPCALGLHIVYDVLIVDNRTESSHICVLFQLAVDHFHGSVNAEAEAC